MPLDVHCWPLQLKFKFNARTSRGTYRTKDTHFIKVTDKSSGLFGIGECGPLAGLSLDDRPDFQDKLAAIGKELATVNLPTNSESAFKLAADLAPPEFPSIRFGLEVALLDLINGGERIIYNNAFAAGDQQIPINGLVWMGDTEFMLKQITDKIYDGYDCIKMKIGSLDFDKECDILEYVRRKYFKQDIIVRVDANGAFKPDRALFQLDRLSKFQVHSIEQPVAAGQIDLAQAICQQTPIPIALDEELIGLNTSQERRDVLGYIKPQFIVLKPTLLGGLAATADWIHAAEELGIGWWITSALESNIGLNAIAQFTSSYQTKLHQGLGTGQLYENNVPSPLEAKSGFMQYRKEGSWELQNLESTPEEE